MSVRRLSAFVTRPPVKRSRLREKIGRLQLTRDKAIAAAMSKIDVADDKIRAAERGLEAASAAEETAKLNLERQQRLNGRGLSSRRNFELAATASQPNGRSGQQSARRSQRRA